MGPTLRGENATFYKQYHMSNMFLISRLYIIKDGKIAMKGGEGPYNYKLEDVTDWIRENVEN